MFHLQVNIFVLTIKDDTLAGFNIKLLSDSLWSVQIYCSTQVGDTRVCGNKEVRIMIELRII